MRRIRTTHSSLSQTVKPNVIQYRTICTPPQKFTTTNNQRPLTTTPQQPHASTTITPVNDPSSSYFTSEHHFGTTADTVLENIQDAFDELDDLQIYKGIDSSYSSGVLTVTLGDKGTWVLNKQTPNKQIWWSSPISGPKRFEFFEKGGVWVNTRDSTEVLGELLEVEVKEVTGLMIECEWE